MSLGFDETNGLGGETGGEYCRICEKDQQVSKVENGEIVKEGVVVRGERRGNMDVIAVPCEWRLLRLSVPSTCCEMSVD